MISPAFPFKRAVAAEALADSETPAIVLYAIVVAAYSDWLYGNPEDPVDPVELWLQIRKDFGVVTDPEVENRINAMRTAVETDAFYTDPEAFMSIIKGVAEGDISDALTGAFEDISVAELAITLHDVTAVRDQIPPFVPAILDRIEEEIREEAEDEESDTPVNVLLEEHKRSVDEWLVKLGAQQRQK